ncbi:MAG: M18 family aminopeptidase [Methylococcales bacterium]|nr:M18 family aminopeptidase [Methylococcales bacterium]
MSASIHAQALLDFIDCSPSAWHAVKSIEMQLADFHFQRLDETQIWNLKTSGRYYVVRGDSSIIAFVHGKESVATSGFKLIGAHTDSPSLRIKPNPQSTAANLARLHVDIYGGAILATFSDRELSLAGRVNYLTHSGDLAQCLVNFERPLLRLPNLAIHLNRGVNEDGLKFQKQHELALIFADILNQLTPSAFTDFTELLQAELPNDAEQILSWDLNVYDTQKGRFWGANNEFFANGQIDNLASCHSALKALLDEKNLQSTQSTLVCAFFDHEEVGSESHCGAASHFLSDTLKRISDATAQNSQDFSRALAKSFMISADMAHAYHPNFPSVYDMQHAVHINQGVVVKINVNQRYATDSVSQAMFIDWCNKADVPYQLYSHRNDLPCGSTIGSIVSQLGLRTVDVGNPMWAMHSCRESAGVFDHKAMIDVMNYFFSTNSDATL